MSDSFNNNLDTLFSKMENFISTKTVVGEPINLNGVIMLPLVDIAFGVGAGGSNDGKGDTGKDADVGGLGAKITPSAVIVIKDDAVQLVNVKNQDAVSKLIDMAPGVLSKLNLGNMFKGKDKEESKEEPEVIIEETTVIETFDK